LKSLKPNCWTSFPETTVISQTRSRRTRIWRNNLSQILNKTILQSLEFILLKFGQPKKHRSFKIR